MDKINTYYRLLQMTNPEPDFLIFKNAKVAPKLLTTEEIKLYYDDTRKVYTNKFIGGFTGKNRIMVL